MNEYFDFNLEPGKLLQKEKYNYKEPEISVIVPFYDDLKYIDQTVNSILNQTYPYFELLIIDDGSKDKKSLDKLEEIKSLDERIKIFHKKNEGLAATRDYGAAKASKKTKYLMFIDSDDLIEKTFLECGYWTLETNKDASWVYSDSIGFDKLSYTWNKWFDSDKMKKVNDLIAASMIRKKDFLEVNGYGLKEKNVNEDWNFWLKMISKGKYPVHMSFYGQWYRRKETGELANAIENKKRSLKIVNNTAKSIHKRVEAVQYPRYDYNSEDIEQDIKNIVIPEKNKKTKNNILIIIPCMDAEKTDNCNLEIIKKLNKEKYNITVVTTDVSLNTQRQQFEKYSTVYDLTSFLNQKYWCDFVKYIIQKNNISLILNSNSDLGYAMLPLLKTRFPNIQVIDIEEYKKNSNEVKKEKVNLCKELITETFLRKKSEYINRVESFKENYSYGENYRLSLFKEKMWQYAPYRSLIKSLQKLRINNLIKNLKS